MLLSEMKYLGRGISKESLMINIITMITIVEGTPC